MIFGFAPPRDERSEGPLPVELVNQIEDLQIIWRGQWQDDDTVVDRPLTMAFLDARAVYLDDPRSVEKVLRRNYPDLTDKQAYRALRMIRKECTRRNGGAGLVENDRMGGGRYGHLKRSRRAHITTDDLGGFLNGGNG
jgi:hypothetical protein